MRAINVLRFSSRFRSCASRLLQRFLLLAQLAVSRGYNAFVVPRVGLPSPLYRLPYSPSPRGIDAPERAPCRMGRGFETQGRDAR